MEFRNEMQKNVYVMVASWFEPDVQAGAIERNAERPSFVMRNGSTAMTISVNPYGDDEAVINVCGWVVKGAKVSPELMQFLLSTNRDLYFGAFGLDAKNDFVTFEHSIIGSTCDKKELYTSMQAVISTADKYDDEIVEKFGGARMRAG